MIVNAFDHWNIELTVLQQYRSQLNTVINSIIDQYTYSFNTSTKYYTDINTLFNQCNIIINSVNTSLNTIELNPTNNNTQTVLQQYILNKCILDIVEQVEYITYIPTALHELITNHYTLHSTYLIQHTLQIILQTNIGAVESLSTVRDQLLNYRNTLIQQCIDRLYQSIYTEYTIDTTLRSTQYNTIQCSITVQRILTDQHSPFIALSNNTSPSNTDMTQIYSFQSLLTAEYSNTILTIQQQQNIYIQSLTYLQSAQQFISYHKRNIQNTIKQLIHSYMSDTFIANTDQRTTMLVERLQPVIERYNYVMSIISKRVQLDEVSEDDVTLQQCIDNEINATNTTTSGINNNTSYINNNSNNVQSTQQNMTAMQFTFATHALQSKMKSNNSSTPTNGIK